MKQGHLTFYNRCNKFFKREMNESVSRNKCGIRASAGNIVEKRGYCVDRGLLPRLVTWSVTVANNIQQVDSTGGIQQVDSGAHAQPAVESMHTLLVCKRACICVSTNDDGGDRVSLNHV